MIVSFRNFLMNCFWAQGNRTWYGAIYTSTALHLVAVTLFAFMWISTDKQPEEHLAIRSQWESKVKDELLQPVEFIELTPDKKSPTPEGGQTKSFDAVVINNQPLLQPSQIRPQTTPVLFDYSASDIPFDTLSEIASKVPSVGMNKQEGEGKGKGEGDGKGDGKGAPFFGIKAEGTNYVYVVDCSSSMNAPHSSESKTRFKRLKLELIRSISKLEPHQRFYVIFFNSGINPMPARGLLFATRQNKMACLEWVAKFPAIGSTDPRSSLMMAMKLNPDVIYFLTDGSFLLPIKTELKKLRQRKTAIHTYAFGNRDGEVIMELIAKQNRGQYTFIP